MPAAAAEGALRPPPYSRTPPRRAARLQGGKTPLEWAREKNHTALVELFEALQVRRGGRGAARAARALAASGARPRPASALSLPVPRVPPPRPVASAAAAARAPPPPAAIVRDFAAVA